MKKFGLIIPSKTGSNSKGPETSKPVKVASIFDEDEEGEDFDDEEKELSALRKAQNASKNVSKSLSTADEFVEKLHQEALKEDANIFDYDASFAADSERKTVHKNLRISEKNKNEEKVEGPKYMHNILAKAEERKIESELIKLRNMKRKSAAAETANEEEVFITAAYRQKLEELEEKEKELKMRQAGEEDGDVRKRKDMTGFYYNLMKRNVSFGGQVTDNKKQKVVKPSESENPEIPEITEMKQSQPQSQEQPTEEPREQHIVNEDDEPVTFGPRRPPKK